MKPLTILWETMYIFEFIQRTNLTFCTLLQLIKLHAIEYHCVANAMR